MDTNLKNGHITKPQGMCNRPPHCLMKNDTAQNWEISINRQTVTFWCGSRGMAPGKVISELILITASWEVLVSGCGWVCCLALCSGKGKMTLRDKRGRREGLGKRWRGKGKQECGSGGTKGNMTDRMFLSLFSRNLPRMFTARTWGTSEMEQVWFYYHN